MKILLENGAELEVLGVHGQTVLHEGVQRDSLVVLMDPEVVDLDQALAAFAPSACGTITLTDKTTGKTMALQADFTDRQKAILKAGGLLGYTKAQGN